MNGNLNRFIKIDITYLLVCYMFFYCNAATHPPILFGVKRV